MSVLYTIAAFVVALAILIVVHEFGHYWVARRVGVKVLRFSVGFGKPIWRKTYGDDRTEFVIAAFPLGGYVRMLDETEDKVAPEELHRAFNRQSLPRRAAVVVAGPLFNLLFAVVAYWGILAWGIDGIKPVIGQVAENSIAARAGVRPGDHMLSVDGLDIQIWGHRQPYLMRRALAQDTVDLRVRDINGREQVRRLDLSGVRPADVGPQLISRVIGLGLLPPPPPVIGEVREGPAKQAGFRKGDRILRINDREIAQWMDMAEVIHASAGKELTVRIDRDGVHMTLKVTPKATEVGGKTVGLISITPEYPPLPDEMKTRQQYGLIAALGEGFRQTWTLSELTLQMMFRMLTLEVSTKNISGPITIAQVAGESASIGVMPFIVFLAIISISLGVLNLLPIPVLDGGHLMYFGIEAIKGSPVSDEARMWGQQIGIVLLILLMVLAFYNDFTRILS